MKILLVRNHDKGNINTRIPESIKKILGVLPPLGLLYVAAALEAEGHEVKIIDAIALNLIGRELQASIVNEKPALVGVTAMISDVQGALEACRIAKESGSLTVVGGPVMSLYSKEILSYGFVDYGVIGEGEGSMAELAKAVEEGRPVDGIKGLCYKKNGEIVIGSARIVDELDSLPVPARHLLPTEKYYSVISLYPVTTMITSRGCPFKCGFCIKGPADAKIRSRDPKLVVDEMEEVVKRQRVKEVMFYDDTLTLKKDSVVKMCEEILRRGLKTKWESPTRVDCVDRDLLRLMRRAGCIRLRYGVESGDPGILRLMNKGTDLGKVKEAFRLSKKEGIETFAYFIIGYIRETEKTIRNTIALARSLEADSAIFTVATPYPGTPLFDLAESEGFVQRDYWRDFILGKRSDRLGFLVPDADKWLSRAYRKFYLRPDYIMRSLLKIRTLHDIKRHVLAAQGLLLLNSYKNNGQ